MSGSSIMVSTSSAAKVATYSLRIVGSVSSFTSVIVYFTLNVVEACAGTVINAVAISDYSYDINLGTLDTIATLAWT
jgi:hypothetical protein